MADGATGVDVSWLHHSYKDYTQRSKPITPPSSLPNDPLPPTSAASHAANTETSDNSDVQQQLKTQADTSIKPVNGSTGATDLAGSGSAAPPSKQHALKRPHLRSRTSTQSGEKSTPETNGNTPSPLDPANASPRTGSSRRNSWISNLSSKFSSAAASPPANPSRDAGAQKKLGSSPRGELPDPMNATSLQTTKDEKATDLSSSTPPKAPTASFLSSALRRLSSSGSGGLGRISGNGTTAQRRILNIDPNRDRCKVPDLDKAKLKRVAFYVDVEIAGYARYDDDDKTGSQKSGLASLEKDLAKKKKDAKDAKLKDMGEGAAFKHPETAVEEKESNGVIEANKEDIGTSDIPKPEGEFPTEELATSPPNTEGVATKKKEKKKRSEAERKERKERKRRLAEANGTIPVEFVRDDDSDSTPSSNSPGTNTPTNGKPQMRPTTDPLRIYKRCAQLRETPALKKVLDQISAPSCILAEAPGTVAVLDLTGVWMKLPDIVTLGDWLSIVPVRKLILENCGLTDEAVKIILSSLLACKTPQQAKFNKKLAKNPKNTPGQEQLGVIEKVSLKENPKLTRLGWEHIGFFMHMSKSLKSIDLSGIPFPKPRQNAQKTTNAANDPSNTLCSVISKGLAERLAGNKLEELIMTQCSLSSRNIRNIVEGAMSCGLRRLGLAENELSSEAMEHVVRYVKSGVCEGLDLGGNQLHGELGPLAEALDERCPLLALSLAACDLDNTDLSALMPAFVKLPNFRFVDFSHNRNLFASQPNALALLRRYLPRIPLLKRIHLSDVDLSPDDAIGLAEVLPECSSLAHISLLENRPLTVLAGAKNNTSQEEACAVYASLMTAVRCSHSIVAIDIEVPSADSSEVVKAIASQIVAYSLRNLERLPLTEGEPAAALAPAPAAANELSRSAPEVLLHLVGHMEGYDDNFDEDEPAPDEDYYISATGVVKALGVCLGTADHTSRRASRDASPAASGAATPRPVSQSLRQKKPKDMSKQLLESARKIRVRLRPALVKEDRLGNDANYRRLQFLDTTLQRIIQRFEDEYPEIRPSPVTITTTAAAKDGRKDSTETSSVNSGDPTTASTAVIEDPLSKMTSNEDRLSIDNDDEPYALRLSRTASNTSLKSRALDLEEGHIHRFGQLVRREILKPEGLDYAHGTDETSVDPPHLAVLRVKLNAMDSQEIRKRVIDSGLETIINELGANAEELAKLEKEDPLGFQVFKEAQLAAQINAEGAARLKTPKHETETHDDSSPSEIATSPPA